MIGYLYYIKSKDSNLCKIGITKSNDGKRESAIDNSHPEELRIKLILPFVFYSRLENYLKSRYKQFKKVQPKGVSGRTEFYDMGFIKRTEVVVIILFHFAFQILATFLILFLSYIGLT